MITISRLEKVVGDRLFSQYYKQQDTERVYRFPRVFFHEYPPYLKNQKRILIKKWKGKHFLSGSLNENGYSYIVDIDIEHEFLGNIIEKLIDLYQKLITERIIITPGHHLFDLSLTQIRFTKDYCVVPIDN